jgi:hypothetical protein
VVESVVLLLRSRAVRVLILWRQTVLLTKAFRDVFAAPPPKASSGIEHQIRLPHFLSTSFAISHSAVIPAFNAMQSDLLKTSLNKLQVQICKHFINRVGKEIQKL